MKKVHLSYGGIIWKKFKRHWLGVWALYIVIAFCVIGIYAPLLASSKPLMVRYEGNWYFPLFRYLFFTGFYTKYLDVFYNLLMFTFPLFLASRFLFKNRPRLKLAMLLFVSAFQIGFFIYLMVRPQDDPNSDPSLNSQQQSDLQKHLADLKANPLTTPPLLASWKNELSYLTDYAKVNLILKDQLLKKQHDRLLIYQSAYEEGSLKKGKKETALPTLWYFNSLREEQIKNSQLQIIEKLKPIYIDNRLTVNRFLEKCQSNCNVPLSNLSPKEKEELLQAKSVVNQYEIAQSQLKYVQDKRNWLNTEVEQLHYEVMPLIRPYHWEDDVGGEQDLNQYISWWELTRINRKNMVAALIFGIRISLSVGLLAIGLALLIGVPLGAIAGYYGGKVDLILYRLIEIWESMPTFFMLLMIVAFLQSKSIFLVIGVIGIFGWTSFSRFIRGEFLKQKQLPYVEACHALGFNDRRIMFNHLLPNATPPLLTLIPFAIMSAITSEAGLSFLGLGEEGSTSWGVLMDEGRSAFPSESYLLWPPAILLTLLLVSIAIVGDSLRDALDPKMH